MVGSGRKYRELKEMRQKEKPVVNLVTPVAQALVCAAWLLLKISSYLHLMSLLLL